MTACLPTDVLVLLCRTGKTTLARSPSCEIPAEDRVDEKSWEDRSISVYHHHHSAHCCIAGLVMSVCQSLSKIVRRTFAWAVSLFQVVCVEECTGGNEEAAFFLPRRYMPSVR
jgi:hypothetical protein